jgi:hypothetical protein
LSYDSVLVESLREKLTYQKSQSFDRVFPDQLLNPDYLFRSSGSFGRTGSTKTTNRIAMIESRLKYGFKVVCFDVQSELEFMGLPCPSDHVLCGKLKSQNRVPKGYRTHVLLPLSYVGGERVVQWSQLPSNWDFFCLNLNDLEVASQDWNILMGKLTSIQEQILKTALLNRQPEWGVLDVYVECQKRYLQGNYGYPDHTKDDANASAIPVVKGIFPKQTITTLNRKLMDLNSTRFLLPQLWHGKNSPFLLDWHRELLDHKTVIILKIGLLHPQFQHALVNYILRKTFLLAQKRGETQVPPIAFLVPELTDYCPKTVPEAKQETLPMLRDTFLELFRKGRRHQIVFDFDSADFGNIPDEVKEQTWYYFVYDSDVEVLNECVRRTGVMNAENLRGTYDLLKEKGSCIFLQKFYPRGRFIRDCIPSCHVAREGENFVDVWRNLYPSKFKSVEPYYLKLNVIHAEMRERVGKVFKEIEDQVELSRKTPLTENIMNLCVWLAKQIDESGKTEFALGQVVNRYQLSLREKISKVTLYEYFKKLEEAGVCNVVKTSKPYTLKLSIERLKQSLPQKEATQ